MTNTEAPRIDLEKLERRAADDVLNEPDSMRVVVSGRELAALVAAVKAARDFLDASPAEVQNLTWHEAFNALDAALQPFTVTK